MSTLQNVFLHYQDIRLTLKSPQHFLNKNDQIKLSQLGNHTKPTISV